MSNKHTTTYNEMLQRLADEYFESTGQSRATTKEIAVWAVSSGQWDPPADLILRKCREDFSRALREQYIEDAAGRPIRAKHAARIISGSTQGTFWADIRTAPRDHMETAFQQRREQIVGDCRQLKRDQDFYNSEHPSESPIQLVFDFSDDIEEGDYSDEYPGYEAAL